MSFFTYFIQGIQKRSKHKLYRSKERRNYENKTLNWIVPGKIHSRYLEKVLIRRLQKMFQFVFGFGIHRHMYTSLGFARTAWRSIFVHAVKPLLVHESEL